MACTISMMMSLYILAGAIHSVPHDIQYTSSIYVSSRSTLMKVGKYCLHKSRAIL